MNVEATVTQSKFIEFDELVPGDIAMMIDIVTLETVALVTRTRGETRGPRLQEIGGQCRSWINVSLQRRFIRLSKGDVIVIK